MSLPIISVENLSKAYRIGVKDEIPDTMFGAISGMLKAPFRNFKKLRSLDTFGKGVGDQVAGVGNQVAGDSEAQKPSSSDTRNPSPETLSSDTRHPTPDTSSALSDTRNPTPEPSSSDLLFALRDVSFDIHQGEVVGIIGGNGAGKSTLLKILSRITEPTSGRVVMRGRVSSLLEVGTGFHPELTGRENIYMNGTVLGMRKKEIERKFDEIVDFSGVEKFLDTPIKRYSSGMCVRLAFAVAAHLEPEILIIDEVLAVGDAEFQKKCLGKMQDVAKKGRTVLFVSHNMAAVESLCSRGIELSQGSLILDGNTCDAVTHYRRHAFAIASDSSSVAFRSARHFKAATLIDEGGERTGYVPLGGDFRLRIRIESDATIRNPQIGIGVDSITGQRMLTVHTPLATQAVGAISGLKVVVCTIPRFPLAPGDYILKLALTENLQELEAIDGVAPFTVANGEVFSEGRGFHRGVCVTMSKWEEFNGEVLS